MGVSMTVLTFINYDNSSTNRMTQYTPITSKKNHFNPPHKISGPKIIHRGKIREKKKTKPNSNELFTLFSTLTRHDPLMNNTGKQSTAV